MQTDSLMSPPRDRLEDGFMDTLRTHKRFLSEAKLIICPLYKPSPQHCAPELLGTAQLRQCLSESAQSWI